MEQAKFAYSPLEKPFEKQTKTIEKQGEKQINAIETRVEKTFLHTDQNQLLLCFQKIF